MGYRKVLQSAWSDATSDESFRGTTSLEVPTSRGQCGVSSAWLIEQLASRQVQRVTYCYGNIYSVAEPERIELAQHCWLEVDSGRYRFVVDLTADQSDVLRQYPVLYAWRDQLPDTFQVDYRAHIRLTPAQLKEDPVQARLALLKGNLVVDG